MAVELCPACTRLQTEIINSSMTIIALARQAESVNKQTRGGMSQSARDGFVSKIKQARGIRADKVAEIRSHCNPDYKIPA